MYLHMSMITCVHIHVEAREKPQVWPLRHHYSFLKWYLICLELTKQARMADQGAPGTCLFLSPSTGMVVWNITPRFFHLDPRDQILMLPKQALSQLSHLSNPYSAFTKGKVGFFVVCYVDVFHEPPFKTGSNQYCGLSTLYMPLNTVII